jgi:hypothetical protein
VTLFESSFSRSMAMNPVIRFTLTSLLCGSLAALAGCDQNKPAADGASVAQLVGEAAPTTDANKPAGDTPAPPAYTPPTAAQLISLLAPVAIFPDKLVAQVLAAAGYPDQIAQATDWLAQNSQLKGDALQQAIDQQNWDPSVKATALFPDVLHQMASNTAWTTALGEAYVNDPNDVMNAIQALRAQALACDKLKSDEHINVVRTERNVAPPTTQYADQPPVYAGPPAIPPPDEIIQIEPTQPDYVYVPYFNPVAYYGTPIDLWPGYYYAWPTPAYYGPVFAFGLGTWIGGGYRSWGWDRWGVNWGNGFDRRGGGRGWRDSAVVYDNRPYVSRSTTAINHYANAGMHAAAASIARTPGTPGTGFAQRGAPTDFSRMAAPRFTAAMAQRSAATATPGRANFARNTTAFANARAGGPTPAGYTSATIAHGAQTSGTLPSSRYAPRQSFANRGYDAQSARGYAARQSMARSYTSAPSMRGPAPAANRAFASAPRMQAASHYSAPRGASSNGGGRGGRSNHR